MSTLKVLEDRKQELIVDRMFCTNVIEIVELDHKIERVKEKIANIIFDKSIN